MHCPALSTSLPSPRSTWLPHAHQVSASCRRLCDTSSEVGALLASRPRMEPFCAPQKGSKPLLGSTLHVPSWSGTALTAGPSPPPHTPHVPAAPGGPSKRLSPTGDKGGAQGPGGTPTLSKAASSDQDQLGNTDHAWGGISAPGFMALGPGNTGHLSDE